MQTIFQTSLTPEQYAKHDHHRQVPPPPNCPNCHRARSLEALAYYQRYITSALAVVLWIWVRRFMPPQQKLWVNGVGSGSLPRLWYKAVSIAL